MSWEVSVDLNSLIAFCGLLVAIAGFLWTRFKDGAALRERIASLEQSRTDNSTLLDRLKHLEDTVTANSDRLTRLETKIELFWNAMMDNAVGALHHPNEEKTDALLDKLKDKTITLQEMEELKCALKQRIAAKIKKKKDGEVFWATFVIARLDTMLYDAHATARTLAPTAKSVG